MKASFACYLILASLFDVRGVCSFTAYPTVAASHRRGGGTTSRQDTVKCITPTPWSKNEQVHNTQLMASGDGNNNSNKSDQVRPGRMQRWRKRVKKYVSTFLFAGALVAARSKPAEAKYSYEIQEERRYSIRPGATAEQASKLMEGEVPEDIPESKSVFDVQSSTESQDSAPTKAKATFDYGDEEGEDDDFMDFEDGKERVATRKGVGLTSKAADKATAQQLQSRTRTQFSGIDPSKTKSRSMYIKVSIGLFVPTWGAMGVREFVRRRKEEAYVKKGLEILEAQRAEYFNVTETTPDSDIEDELKDLKDGDDDDDDDDDDEDSDDDDDADDDDDEPEKPPPSSRKGPKRPPGGGGDGGSSGGSGGDPGYGRPSDDDLKRLGDLFNKS